MPGLLTVTVMPPVAGMGQVAGGAAVRLVDVPAEHGEAGVVGSAGDGPMQLQKEVPVKGGTQPALPPLPMGTIVAAPGSVAVKP